MRPLLIVFVIVPVLLHGMVVRTIYLEVEADFGTGPTWLVVALLDLPVLAVVGVVGEPQWMHHSNWETALWFLIVGTVQWAIAGFLAGLLWVHALKWANKPSNPASDS